MSVHWRDRLRLYRERYRRRLDRTRSGGWRGLSVLIFQQDAADHPVRLRINYYVIVFSALLVAGIPLAGAILVMQESLTAADASQLMESRRSLLHLMRLLTEEKEQLVVRAAEHIDRFGELSRADGTVLRSASLPAFDTADVDPNLDRVNYDLAKLEALHRRSRLILRNNAYHSMQLVWTRMAVHHAMPRGRPLPAGVGFLTSVFGNRPNPFGVTAEGSRETHSGIDFASAPGTPLIATAPGLVIRAVHGTSQGYGKHVRIHHGFGYTTLYGHCRELAVDTGDVVRRGQVIGYLGRTGRATGNHVHYEVQLGADLAIDPMEYVQLK